MTRRSIRGTSTSAHLPRRERPEGRFLRRSPGLSTVASMTASSHDRHSSAAWRPLANVYEDLRSRNARRADLARSRDMRIRIERALQAAQARRFHSRG
jgi:hypothetical protein